MIFRKRLLAVALVCASCSAAEVPEMDPPDRAMTDARVADATLAAADSKSIDAAIAPDAALPDAFLPPPAPEVLGASLLADENPDPLIFEANLVAAPHRKTLDDGTNLEMWLYNGQFPGPLVDVRVGQRVIIHFRNELELPTTIHWHGLRISSEMDGNPRIQDPVEPGGTFTYDFVVPEAGTFWYHPHIKANEQVERGLYAPFIVREAAEVVWDVERAFIVDDMLLSGGDFALFLASHSEEMHGRHGNVLVTNGHVEPGTGEATQGQVERWRFINPANARTMRLRISGAEFRVIGTDGGGVSEAYTTPSVLISPGQRYDVEVRYPDAGLVVLESLVEVLVGDFIQVEPITLFTATVSASELPVPEWRFQPRDLPRARRSDRRVTLELDARNGPNGLEWLINGASHAHEPLFTFKKGDIVDFTISNLAGPEHPFHLHGQFFEIFPGDTPETDQPGLKDVVLVPGLSDLRVRAYLDNPGEWMMHCHILEHAELGMMATFLVEE